MKKKEELICSISQNWLIEKNKEVIRSLEWIYRACYEMHIDCPIEDSPLDAGWGICEACIARIRGY